MSDAGPTRPGPIVMVVLMATAVVAAACGSAGGTPRTEQLQNTGVIEDDGTAVPGGQIVYGIEAESDGWNPSNSKWGPAGLQVARTFFDTLAAYDANGHAQPDLAEALVPNDTYTEWTIRLRPGVRLHNGRRVDAALVKENFDFLKSSVLTSAPFEPIESFEVRGPLEVLVHMKRPWVNYPYALTTQIGVVADPDWLRSGSKTDPVGTGAFVFKEWVPDARLIVERNPDYWRVDPSGTRYPYLDRIEFRPLSDNDSRAASLEAGNIDIMQAATARQLEHFAELGEQGKFQVFNDVSGETAEVFIQLNTMAPPFNDLEARRALALATDAQAFVNTLHDGFYEVARGPFSPGSPWYTETDHPSYDLSSAKKAAQEVKARHDGRFSFKILGGGDASSLSALQLLESQWEQAGIDVQIEPIEQAQLITNVATGNYQATIWRQFDSPHPIGDSVWWHPNTAKPIPEVALNFARNRDERIGAALDDARETTDPAREKELYQQVQRYLAEDLPYIWLYHAQISIVASNRLVNVVNYRLPGGQKGIELLGGSHPLWQVWLRS
ncbi:ABC transporter substrate-binding protein [Rhabdothermincola sediminis]|uniref:ABC transporter substrate-binding protein n=1 Tax=Rhabdothermincola sediminis TaxID=2751370 RepID=UPI001AA022EC|nr:ABC transporter substrate-binding protein [Rhabdothermincola sediminis]